MTLADALAKVDTKLEAIAASIRADLIEQFRHATPKNWRRFSRDTTRHASTFSGERARS